MSTNKTIIEIIRDSLTVDQSGTVRFRSRIGRGSGKAMEIPSEQFDEFVSLMLKTKENKATQAVAVSPVGCDECSLHDKSCDTVVDGCAHLDETSDTDTE